MFFYELMNALSKFEYADDAALVDENAAFTSSGRELTKQRGLRVHMARWCDGGRTQRSRLGTLTDEVV